MSGHQYRRFHFSFQLFSRVVALLVSTNDQRRLKGFPAGLQFPSLHTCSTIACGSVEFTITFMHAIGFPMAC
jgi:hypothetical protein